MIGFLRGAIAAVGLLGLVCGLVLPATAQEQAPRIALVIGNGAYPAAANPTAPNDAGLVAQTLTAAGFDVTGARDLDSDGVRGAFRDFLGRAAQLGPDGIVFVYLSGYAVQYEGDNYFVPVDAKLERDSDVAIQGIRVSDLTRALSGVPLLARVVVIDAAYQTPFAAANSLAGGLALVDPEPGTLLAFNAAPGTLGPATTEPYGVYGQALAEMLRQGGVPVGEVFDRVRLRVNEATRGSDVPWSASKLTGSFVFLERSPDAPAPVDQQTTYAALERRPIREFPVNEAYNAAVARDTFQGYQDFLTAYPRSPYAARVRGLVGARREALTWSRTASVNTGDAYWSYLRRYPKGPHASDSRRRLRALSVALAPPPDFAPIEYDVPPPPEDEVRFVDTPVIVFDEPDYGPPPPPPPEYFLPPPVETIYDLPPPPPSIGPGFLPIPIPIPIPFARPFARPGELRPLRGAQGGYAQPRPFAQAPNGGLLAQPPGQPGMPVPPPGAPPFNGRPGGPGAAPSAPPAPGQFPRPLPGQAGTPVPGQPPAPGLPPGTRPGVPGAPVLPGQLPQPGQPGAFPRPLPGQPGAPNGLPPRERNPAHPCRGNLPFQETPVRFLVSRHSRFRGSPVHRTACRPEGQIPACLCRGSLPFRAHLSFLVSRHYPFRAGPVHRTACRPEGQIPAHPCRGNLPFQEHLSFLVSRHSRFRGSPVHRTACRRGAQTLELRCRDSLQALVSLRYQFPDRPVCRKACRPGEECRDCLYQDSPRYREHLPRQDSAHDRFRDSPGRQMLCHLG